jgi:hypothetical protein
MNAPVRRDQLIQMVERSLAVLETVYKGHAAESDLYEAALVSIAVEAARAAGGAPMITYDGRSATTQLRFRRAPGNLWKGDFTFVRLDFPRKRSWLEIHLGVKVVGSSGVAHECDVAILDGDEAELARIDYRHPRRAKLVAAIEGKNYSVSPDLGVGRAFLGLGAELAKEKCNLAFPAKGSGNIMKLVAKRNSGVCFDELTPQAPARDRLQAHLETALRNWVASQS